MYSLIVSIISILLVAALAMATVNYSGGTVASTSGKARAAKISNQAEQLIAAATLFRTNYGRWPDDLEELLSNGEFIRRIPLAEMTSGEKARLVAQKASEFLVPVAHAEAEREWLTVSASTPQYVLSRRVSTSACLLLNNLRLGVTGIRSSADPAKPMQCFGQHEPYTVLAQVPEQGAPLTTEALQDSTGDPSIEVEAEGGTWTVEPSGGPGGAPSPNGGATSNSVKSGSR